MIKELFKLSIGESELNKIAKGVLGKDIGVK